MIKSIDHIAIAVPSIAEARKFYENMGLEVAHIEDVPQEGVKVAMIWVGPTRIELIEPLGEDSPVHGFLAKRGPGMHHLCFASDAIHDDNTKLQGDGYRTLRPEPTPGAEECWVQFVHPKSAGGVLVELNQKMTADELEQARAELANSNP